jgi:predicted lipoprotein with Yx(FWY)xxD motif
MTRRRPITLLATAVAVPLAAVAIAACGSDDTPTATPKTASGDAATIDVANSDLGKILVDAKGRTIYLFKKDAGTKSECSGDCVVDWPPVTAAGKPTVGTGLTASKVATTQSTDGKTQVTYNGHPLYLFQGDKSPGDTSGQGLNAFGAGWFVLSPAGDEITAGAPKGGSTGGY